MFVFARRRHGVAEALDAAENQRRARRTPASERATTSVISPVSRKQNGGRNFRPP